MSDIRQPFESAESEFVEKRSRFISHIWPVETEEEAQAHIKEMKSKYYDARHNCWCYAVGSSIVRYSDDGEPQGTAGQPMLKVLERENITNYCCVVTRYFGGILLGAGGLTRAYAKGAKDALIASGAATLRLWKDVRIPCPYPLFERVKLEIENVSGMMGESEFGSEILISCFIPGDALSLLEERLTELSAGKISVKVEGEVYQPGPREEVL